MSANPYRGNNSVSLYHCHGPLYSPFLALVFFFSPSPFYFISPSPSFLFASAPRVARDFVINFANLITSSIFYRGKAPPSALGTLTLVVFFVFFSFSRICVFRSFTVFFSFCLTFSFPRFQPPDSFEYPTFERMRVTLGVPYFRFFLVRYFVVFFLFYCVTLLNCQFRHLSPPPPALCDLLHFFPFEVLYGRNELAAVKGKGKQYRPGKFGEKCNFRGDEGMPSSCCNKACSRVMQEQKRKHEGKNEGRS